MPYSTALDTAARRDLANLERFIGGRVSEAVDALANNPRPRGVKKWSGQKCGIEYGLVTIESSMTFMMSRVGSWSE